MTPLRQRMIDELVRRNYGARTIKTYVGNMVAIARHFKKSPDKLTADEVRAWQLGLREQGLSFSTYNTHSCALRFFFRYVDPRGEDLTTLVPFARRERKLPAILSQAEVRALLAAITDGRDRVMVTIAYACAHAASTRRFRGRWRVPGASTPAKGWATSRRRPSAASAESPTRLRRGSTDD